MMFDAGIVVFLVLFIVFFCLVPYCCRRRKRYLQQIEMQNMDRVQEVIVNGQRVIRVATVSTNRGHMSLDVYEIHLNSQNGPTSSVLPSYEEMPPPPFQTALQDSTPVVRDEIEELPPPSYEDFMKVHTATGVHEDQDHEESSNENNTRNTYGSDTVTVIDSSSNDSPTQRY